MLSRYQNDRWFFPASVRQIGKEAFKGCSSLSSVTVYNPGATFGADVFKDVPESLIIHGLSGSTAEDYAFANSISFEAIDAPISSSGSCGDNLIWSFDSATGTVTVTGTGPMWDYSWDDYSNQSPFDANETITSATIEEGVTSIGAWFFNDCHNLTSVSLPSTLKRIEEGAFYDNDLAELTIPDGVTSEHHHGDHGQSLRGQHRRYSLRLSGYRGSDLCGELQQDLCSAE